MDESNLIEVPARVKKRLVWMAIISVQAGVLVSTVVLFARLFISKPADGFRVVEALTCGIVVALMMFLAFAVYQLEPFSIGLRSKIRRLAFRAFSDDRATVAGYKRRIERMIKTLNFRYYFDYRDDYVDRFAHLVSMGFIVVPGGVVGQSLRVGTPCRLNAPLDIFGVPIDSIQINGGICIGPSFFTNMEFDEVVQRLKPYIPGAVVEVDEQYGGRSYGLLRDVKQLDGVDARGSACVVGIQELTPAARRQIPAKVSILCAFAPKGPMI